jgi:hypothetical protein
MIKCTKLWLLHYFNVRKAPVLPTQELLMILLPDKSGEIISASTTILYHPAPILAMGVFWYPFLRAIAISQQKG